MNDSSFVSAADIVGERIGPLADHLDAYVALVKAQGFSPGYIRHHIWLLARFSQWLQRGHRQLRALNESVVEQFFRARRRRRGGEPAILIRMLELLRRRGVTLEKRQPPLSLKEKVVAEFRRYLLKERGLSAKTAFGYGPFINRFLSETFRDGRLSFAHLRAPDVTDFVRRHAYNAGRAYARHLVQALRSFLRYLRLQGKIKTDLEGCVLSVAAWSLASLPKFIPAEAVEKVLASCDRDTANGKRNHAILLLLARLGLRAGEVIHLNLDDIDWDNGTITFHAKGNRQSRMPLPAEVGEALALYLQVRRHCACRRVFLCDGAPVRGFSNSNGISTLVRRALERAKVEAAHTGAHLFRHSLATEMLRKNASLDEIGEVLRHKSPDTTAIYAKVDIAALRRLALPWPGGAR